MGVGQVRDAREVVCGVVLLTGDLFSGSVLRLYVCCASTATTTIQKGMTTVSQQLIVAHCHLLCYGAARDKMKLDALKLLQRCLGLTLSSYVVLPSSRCGK